jgi:YHS domain-containing protein
MKNNRIGRVLSLLAVLLGPLVSLDVLSSFAQSQQASSVQSTQMPTTDALPEGRLTRIDARRVCMVRNHAFEEPQLPIDIKGRTYYGCCDMCKGMLAKDRKRRVAIDPVSKKKVDKAMAVIGVGANKGVLYFENETNLEKYNSSH